jgi:hypothetical protein
MTRKAPWHSIRQNVHHDNDACKTGRRIVAGDLREGAGNRPLCKECRDLNARDAHGEEDE